MRFALVVEYDGAEFRGSQYQANARTVQGDLEIAANIVFGRRDERIRMASRTDAGVHALGQIAALDLDTDMSTHEIRNALNGNLADDVRVLRVAAMLASFDPRRDAVAREYRYVINDGITASPLRRRYEYHVRRRLDIASMSEAAHLFIGVHDFASFAAASKENGSTVRLVQSSEVYRRTDDDRVIFDVRANAFVRQQIRRMAASLIAVGRGASTIEEVSAMVSMPKRGMATQNAPPHALTLMRVVYPSESGLDVIHSK